MLEVTSFAAGAAAVAVPAGLLLYRTWRALGRERHKATHDPLTGLLNRAAFKDRAVELLAVPAGAAVVAIVDLDRLKAINDAPGLGHDAGDAVLVAVAARMVAVVGGHGLVARLGGDEFAVAVTAPAGVDVWRVDRLFAELAARINDPVPVQANVDVRVSASIGVAPVDGVTDLSGLLKRADRAMYRAKAQSGFRVAVIDPGEPVDVAPCGRRPQVSNQRPWLPVWGGLR
jgi:diguanylate cyclase (GGDEF)-like protein